MTTKPDRFAWMANNLFGYPTPYPPFPVEVDGKSCAVVTDGVILVIADLADDDIVPKGNPPSWITPVIVSFIRRAFEVKHTVSFAAWKAFLGPSLPPEALPCKTCDHLGTVACVTCGGEGQISKTCDDCGHSHSCDCKTCGGSGAMTCTDCQGGANEVPRVRYGWILDGFYDLVRMLDVCPHLEAAADAPIYIACEKAAKEYDPGILFVDGPGWRIVLHGIRLSSTDVADEVKKPWQRLG